MVSISVDSDVEIKNTHIVFLQAVINEVCKHRPLNLGPFVVFAFLCSSTSEGLLPKIDPMLPKEVVTKESSKEAA